MTEKKELGNRGEEIAKEYLLKNNYSFITQNYKSSYQELDLIFRKENKYIFVEVKTRTESDEEKDEAPLTKWQTKNIQRALIEYCLKNYINLDNSRLDLITILIESHTKLSKLTHYKNILS
ncbi:MAG: YraN family protein [Patescibacteria group bacterium]